MNFKHHVDANEINNLILNSTEPLIFKDAIKTELLNWDLDKWCEILGNQDLQFRCGKNRFTREPQWERTTKIRSMKFREFLNEAKKDGEEWFYFDYKYLREWFLDVNGLRENITWDSFGFPQMSVEDSTIWIGSKGAHTPCHMDTYGCNIVVQIYGQKRWLIFPPEENLKPSRVPYEESSIYSKLNFFSPSVEDFRGLNGCRNIILSPGDVLFLPHKWWHYVENLDTSISVNLWVPLEIDDEERLNEAIVQMLVKQFCSNLASAEQEVILNPNIKTEINGLSSSSAMSVVETCRNKVNEKQKNKRVKTNGHSVKPVITRATFGKHDFIEKIPPMKTEDLKIFIEEQTKRFKDDDLGEQESTNFHINLINAMTHPDVVDQMKEKLLL